MITIRNIGLLLVILLASCAMGPNSSLPTMSQAGAVAEGMTFAQVTEIIGSPLSKSSRGSGYEIHDYRLLNSSGGTSPLYIGYENGRVQAFNSNERKVEDTQT